MTFKIPILFSLMFCVLTSFCQERFNKTSSAQNVVFLDSIKKTFKTHKSTSRIDSLWMKELLNKDLFETVETDIATLDIDQSVDFNLPTDLLKSRLAEMDAKSPFNIEWNQGLENTIKQFLKNRKKSFERLMAISDFYFPQFEEALSKENVPLEIKYLAIVESALNPRAVSKMGATGLWQFMYHTGKNYGLNIDSYTDERSDPILASKAAAVYMKNMYKVFGDWDLVLASYNSGPGNVTKAIRRADGQQNFWNIKKYLPKETQGYVPAFLATMYIFEYHKAHGIKPQKAALKHFETDTIMVKQQLSFKQISDLVQVPVAQLQFLNPQYKTDVIPFQKNTKHFLRMPTDKIAVFASNEDKIYAYANFEIEKREKQYFAPRKSSVKINDAIAVNDSLRQQSATLNVNLSQSDVFKGAKNDRSTVLNGSKNAFVKNQSKIKTSETDKLSNSNQTIENQFYTVQKGDNLNNIAAKFNVTIADIKLWNNLTKSTISLNSKLQISKIETISSSETTVAQPINNKTHIVKEGENIWTVAEQYGLTAKELRKGNELESNTISEGLILKIDKADFKKSKNNVAVKERKNKRIKNYDVLKGDTLIEIADKFPGVTVEDLRKWNKIKSNANALRAGMKLKIQG